MNNKIITISGADLAGKQTQCKLLADAMDIWSISFPQYNTIIGQLIKSALTESRIDLSRIIDSKRELQRTLDTYNKNNMNPYIFQCLQLANRLEFQKAIKEKLKDSHVICDRYDIDSLIYGFVDGCNKHWLEESIKCLIPSDIVLILNNPIFSRNETKDINESNTKFLNDIKKRYIEEAPIYGWHIIDTIIDDNEPIKGIHQTHIKLCEIISEKLSEEILPSSIHKIEYLLK